MKKRVVAIILCLAMSVSGSGIVRAAELSSEAAAQETEIQAAETAETGETEDAFSEEDGMTADDGASSQEAAEEEQAEDTDSSADAADETGETENSDSQDFESENLFDDGTAVTAEVTEDETETASATSLESDGVLLYTRWVYDDKNGEWNWRLQKYSEDAFAEPEYYTAADGIVSVKTLYTDGRELVSGKYLFDENGYLLTGDQSLDDNVYHFTTADEADVTADDENNAIAALYTSILTELEETAAVAQQDLDVEEAVTEEQEATAAKAQADVISWNQIAPILLGYGTMTTAEKVNVYVWDKGTGKFVYYDAEGIRITEFTDKTVISYGGAYFCLKKDGTPYTSVVTNLTVNGTKGEYYFGSSITVKDSEGNLVVVPGKMVTSTWAKFSGNTKAQNSEKYGYYYRYYGSSGARQTKKSGVYKVENNSKIYFIYSDGYLVRSKAAKAGANGKWYASDSNGLIYTNCLVSVKNDSTRAAKSGAKSYSGYSRYFFTTDGTRATYKNQWVKLSRYNRYFYFGKTEGKLSEKTGFQCVKVNGKYVGWIYFNGNNNAIVSCWKANHRRYFKADGIMASGAVKVNGSYYYFQKSTSSKYYGKCYLSQMIKTKSNGKVVYLYATSNGKLVKSGWKKISGYWYYFKNYYVQTSQKLKKGSQWGRTDSLGRWQTGWIVFSDKNNKVAYLNPSTGEYVKSKVIKIDGKYYRFNSSGFRVNDRSSEYQSRYAGRFYLECDRVNGVMTVYTDSSKTIPVKTIRVSVGLASTPTTLGTFTLTRSARWQALMGPSWGQYGTHVVNGIYVHSIACSAANCYNLAVGEYNKLGNPASHGCIRCCVADAKWVYTYCNGSTIRVFDGTYTSQEAFKGPLGRNKLVPVKAPYTSDPTDPAVYG